MPTVPTYDLPQSPILIVGFFGILFTLVLLYFVNRAYFESPLNRDRKMKTALFLSDYDLSTVHYLCSYYKDNANLDKEDIEYINELQNRVDSLMEVTK